MLKNHAKAQLKAGECIYGTSVEYCLDPEISVLMKKAGLDLFFIDTEHQTASYKEIRAICRSARDFEIPALVRVTQNQPELITRALDCGAMGIVVPRVHSAAEATAAVDSMLYTPDGNRGFGMHSIMTNFEWAHPVEMMAEANHETLAICQVESRAALESIEEIAAVPGLDALFIGPYDLSISMGIAEQFRSTEFWCAVDRVVAAAKVNGIAAALQTGDMWILKEARRRGVRLLFYSGDFAVLFAAYKEKLAEIRAD
jgi:2-keto-3-deoxy-L-rhamnonate aldolase RhmA